MLFFGNSGDTWTLSGVTLNWLRSAVGWKKPAEENSASDQTCMIPGAHPPPPGQFPGLPPGQPIPHQPHPTMQMMSPYLGQPMQGQALAGGAAPPVPVHAVVYDHTQVDGGPQV